MTIETRISKLEAKLKTEKAKKQKADALQRTRTAKRQRQDDTRPDDRALFGLDSAPPP